MPSTQPGTTVEGGNRPLLTADWRYLAILNYPVVPAFLERFVPRGCELDFFDGQTFVSVVGFLFANTHLRGIPIPFHRTFEEVNLRFYVRRMVDGETRRAVTFLREFVPRRMIALVARMVYNEPYRAVRMSHRYAVSGEGNDAGRVPVRVEYEAGPVQVVVHCDGMARLPVRGSFEQFIAEHYWGYTTQRDGGTVEYIVEHPPWRVAPAASAHLGGDLSKAYGAGIATALASTPHSAFVAEGSAVRVFKPVRIVP